MGLDTNLDGWTLGGFAGYSRSDIDSDRAGAGSDVDSYHAGVYGGRSFEVGGPGVLGLNLGAGFTWHETEAQRRVNLPGDTQNLSADYSAQSYQLFSELGYRMESEAGALEPYAGLSYLRQDTEGYEEKGGSAALIRESSTRNTYYATLGLRGETSFALEDERSLTLRGGLGWRHAFGDVTPTVEQRFAGGESFSISGAPIDRDAALLETGLDLELSETTTLSLDYDGQLSPNAQEHTGRLELSVRF
ncbi:autotransporter outer membrane beta-barrel domain-containing protein [Fodinicurvata sediminis]|uniref:autotransporter outer membrane beta-barrel domain-containing protein n=1 Tax=Fodinicurvata sediminis TaxID=1121832 RepID=UPI0003B4181E|nr:autotransporter outer membrane beta-barrel domain-containing protein [Fodinicurvata sediminis]